MSFEDLQKLRKEAKTKQTWLYSCWEYNLAHEHLKKADYVICCFECGNYFYKGVKITE